MWKRKDMIKGKKEQMWKKSRCGKRADVKKEQMWKRKDMIEGEKEQMWKKSRCGKRADVEKKRYD